MDLPQGRGDWGRLAGYVGLSLGLYYLSVLDTMFFLFAVPLEVLYARKGRTQYWIAAAAVFAGIALFALLRTSAFTAGRMRLLLVVGELAVNALIIVSVDLVNAAILRRRLYRLLLATGIAGAVTLPVVLLLAGSSEFAAVMHNQISRIVDLLNASFGSSAQNGTPVFRVEQIAGYVRQVILGNYLFGFFLMITGVWRLGAIFSVRWVRQRPVPLALFFLPEGFLWPTLVAWAGVLANRYLHVEWFGYAVWNLAMIGAFLYGLQGVGIVQYVFARFRISRGVRLFLVVLLAFLVLFPGVGTIIAIAFPILGISELWIRYGRKTANQQEE